MNAVTRDQLFAHMVHPEQAEVSRHLLSETLVSLGWAERAEFGPAEVATLLGRFAEIGRALVAANAPPELEGVVAGYDMMLAPIRRTSEALAADKGEGGA